jgi:hypothetical protein
MKRPQQIDLYGAVFKSQKRLVTLDLSGRSTCFSQCVKANAV